jgi:hypothetical protein
MALNITDTSEIGLVKDGLITLWRHVNSDLAEANATLLDRATGDEAAYLLTANKVRVLSFKKQEIECLLTLVRAAWLNGLEK